MKKLKSFAQQHPGKFSVLAIIAFFILYAIVTVLFALLPIALSESDKVQLADGLSRVLLCAALVLFLRKIYDGNFRFYFTSENLLQGLKRTWFFVLVALSALLAVLVIRDGEGNMVLSASTIFIILFSSIMTGFYEEMFFRGLLLQNLLKKGIMKAVVISSIMFGLIHLVNGIVGFQVISAALFGIYLSAIYLRTKNIWPIIAIHALWDTAMFWIADLGTGLQGANFPEIAQVASETSDTGDASIIAVVLVFLLPVFFDVILALGGLFMLRKSKHEAIKKLWGLEG